jgi:pyruvate/2-oxoglutarate dehydrogenase complex dihydrolipoamide acyltransferase (E2) component
VTERSIDRDASIAPPVQLVPVIVPQLGNAMEEVTVAEWYVGVGERVEEGEPIVMIDSEKAQSELEAPASGTLQEVLVPDGGTAEAGDRLALVAVG